MLNQLDQILKDILDDSKAPKELKDAEVSFEIPKENYAPDKDTINLYLYDIHENRKLRDPSPIYELVDGDFVKKSPPIRVDCSYMLTAWNGKTGEHSTADEHLLLSQALTWFSSFPEIPAKYFPADWKDKSKASYQMFPVYLSVAQFDGIKDPGEFWAALGSPPRPYINVTATIAMTLKGPDEMGPPVEKRIIITGQREKDKEELKTGTEEQIEKTGK
ncbi:DUF4255 domain-containing protein [candidate division KSB1 bacterium]|nr:DUF4255 domain-containing protein [candidate division KSB1 bacterium]